MASQAAALETFNRFVARMAYRHLIAATRLAFKGDKDMLKASHKQVRKAFADNRRLRPGSTEAEQAVEHAQGVTKILRENVVQGKRNENGNYKLNIHKETERGDNDTAGQLKGTSKTWKEVKDSSF